uniref:DUF4397 domain-containing protein n=1 Tax=Pithovirus LCPAC102 TaxID=2506587 RepID=A0A481Z307_9VIRU|nr:MAG: protein of unknown function DUF4397 [Pithovirus LCPAC102]
MGLNYSRGYNKCRSGMSSIRLIHNISSELKVNVSLDGNIRARNVEYKDVSDYLEIEPGMHSIKIYDTETKECISKLSTIVKVCRNKVYTIIITGLIDYFDTLKLLPIEDHKEAKSDENTSDENTPDENISDEKSNALVRFIHAASGVYEDGVDVWNRAGDGDLKVFEDYKYQEASKYVEVNPGTLSLLIAPTGSMDGVGPLEIEVKADKKYTIIASGVIGSEKYPINTIVAKDNDMLICLYK